MASEVNYNDGKWHGWNGGECPVHPSSMLDYITAVDGPVRRESCYGSVAADRLTWTDDSEGWRVVAFRVIKEHKEPREWWVSEDVHCSGNTMYDHPAEGRIHVREVIDNG